MWMRARGGAMVDVGWAMSDVREEESEVWNFREEESGVVVGVGWQSGRLVAAATEPVALESMWDAGWAMSDVKDGAVLGKEIVVV